LPIPVAIPAEDVGNPGYARDGGDDAGRSIHTSHHVVVGVREEDVAACIHRKAQRLAEQRRSGLPPSPYTVPPPAIVVIVPARGFLKDDAVAALLSFRASSVHHSTGRY